MKSKLEKPKPYFISSDPIEIEDEEDWPYWECFWCGIIDEMDQDEESDGGLVFMVNGNEFFLCYKCKQLFFK